MYKTPGANLVIEKHKENSGFFSQYAASLSWLLPIAIGLIGPSLITATQSMPILAMSVGVLILIGFAFGVFLGIWGLVQFKRNKLKSVLLQSIIGTIVSTLLLVLLLVSSISSFIHYSNQS